MDRAASAHSHHDKTAAGSSPATTDRNLRKAQATLDELTVETFDKLSDFVLRDALNFSDDEMQTFITSVFEFDESFAPLYADLCCVMAATCFAGCC